MKSTAATELQEKKSHGTILFPFNIYPCNIPGDFSGVSLHWQESGEIIYVKKGVGNAQVGTEVQKVTAGDVCILPPETLHALKEEPGHRMEYENMIFDMGFLGAGNADVCAREYLVPFMTGNLIAPRILRRGDAGYDEIITYLSEMERLCEQKMPGYELGVKALILQILFLLIQKYPERPKQVSADTERLKMVLHKIDTEYMTELTIDGMSQFVGCSSSHFMRWFKQMTGSSFGSFLNDKRLAVAAKDLKETEEKILTIAESVGFENLSNFNRQFKARYKMTPKEYRKN